MHQTTQSPALAKTLAAIASLDLEPIKFKIACKDEGYGWTPEHTAQIELAYRRFLMLLARYPASQLAPTRDIDKFWHAHILDTRKYAADCQQLFGEFIHHHPYLGMRGDADVLAQAADSLEVLYRNAFGEELPGNAAAWCGSEVRADKAVAWCGSEGPTDKAAAWCGSEGPTDKAAAWCGSEVRTDKAAAWCGSEVRADKTAAWCGSEVRADKATAWCGSEVRADGSLETAASH
ncbi:glycine-rich domain-containing protein [Aquabacterium sp.]|uniref:glycine-rich domain-containing protein n=1 Tax=Aquabacterium sp. TaxID=1872578 RepID=UPI002BB9CF12|nr:glycine-rich domain-containing protein-like [Aquabacterium sp.]HSW08817.1 glycine-rich domain-containing protein-like [Aquabacterium sp.]